ncbi:DUF3348 family protein [Ramlibacter rhizophilus]|uniref:DUF3348 family protein n=1 Tax=Ramlibacter rhizophilus TaxID=1781167 RepID=UPI00143232BB|nr:DUF3348 family protein [Ramlibacter rhizophilus]
MLTHSSPSALVGLLARTARVDAGPASRHDIAQRLAPWVDAFDAVTLHSVHQSLRALDGAPEAGPQAAPPLRGFEDSLRRLRASLEAGIAAIEPPTPSPALPVLGADAAFAPLRRLYLHQQRLMEAKIAPLRVQLRSALAGAASPRLRQLATLDAALEQMLHAREQKLLAGVPAWLQARFATLRAEGAAGSPDGLAAIGREMRQLLLAELDLRLQPVRGLLGALAQHHKEVE